MLKCAIIARKQPRRRLADVADAEGEDEAVETDLAPRFDRGEQIVDLLFGLARLSFDSLLALRLRPLHRQFGAALGERGFHLLAAPR